MKNYLFHLLFATIVLSSCTTEINKPDESSAEYTFPVFIDDSELTTDTVIFHWLNHGSHYPMYFGKLNDTIKIDHNTFIPLAPVLQNGENQTYERTKGDFDDYYLAPLTYKGYSNPDSVELNIKIDTSQFITNQGRKAYPVIIENLHSDTIYIGYGDHIPIITEAKTKNGTWKPIEEQFRYMCGNGIYSIILPPDQIVLTSELVYSGSFKTKLRIKIGQNYSREFVGYINKSQFESEWDVHGNRKEKWK